MEEKQTDVKKVVSIVVLVLLFLFSIGGSILSYNMRHPDSGSMSSDNPAAATKRPSDYKIGIPYEKASKDSKPALVLFYADWCHFCIDFMPKYEVLYNTFKSDMNFVKINVEDPKYKDLVQEYQIGGFPTVFLIDFSKGNKVLLDNSIFSDMGKLKGKVANFIKSVK